MKWLTQDLKNEIKSVFESRYKRNLTDEEIIEISINLTGIIESCLKSKSNGNFR